MTALAFFMNLFARMESLHPHLRRSTLLSSPSIEYKGRAFGMIQEDRIILRLDNELLPETRQIGWQFYKPNGRPVYLQQWVEVPYYYHHDWPELAEKALIDMKDRLGE